MRLTSLPRGEITPSTTQLNAHGSTESASNPMSIHCGTIPPYKPTSWRTSSTPPSLLATQSSARYTVITPATITTILHLPTGTTETVNLSPNPKTYDEWTGQTGSIFIHQYKSDGSNVSQGPADLQAQKFRIQLGIYFKGLG